MQIQEAINPLQILLRTLLKHELILEKLVIHLNIVRRMVLYSSDRPPDENLIG